MIDEIQRQIAGHGQPGCVVASVGGGGLLTGLSLYLHTVLTLYLHTDILIISFATRYMYKFNKKFVPYLNLPVEAS